MFNVLIISHGNLASALLESAAMICGTFDSTEVVALGLQPGDNPDFFKEEIRNILESWQGKEILVLSDLRSGTPFNVATQLMREIDFQHFCGVNLGLVIEALMNRDVSTAEDITSELTELAPQTILNVSKFMKGA